MKKLLNDPNNYVTEMLDGLLKAHGDMLSFAGDDRHCIVRADAPVEGKVALATGGSPLPMMRATLPIAFSW